MSAYDQGFDLYKREPELSLAAVWHKVPRHLSVPEQHAFVSGYQAARLQRNEFEREQRETESRGKRA